MGVAFRLRCCTEAYMLHRMPTSQPRISVTLNPESSHALKRLASAGGGSQSSIVADLLNMAAPTFERLATVLELASKAQASSREALRSDLAASQQMIEAQLGGLTGELDRLMESMSAPPAQYSALAPSGERVLLPVGHFLDKSGVIRTGDDTAAAAAGTVAGRGAPTPFSNRGVTTGKTRGARPSKPVGGKS